MSNQLTPKQILERYEKIKEKNRERQKKHYALKREEILAEKRRIYHAGVSSLKENENETPKVVPEVVPEIVNEIQHKINEKEKIKKN